MFLDISFTILWRCKLKSPQNGNLKKRIIHLSRNITHMTYATFIFVKVFWILAPCKGIQDSLGFWIPCCGFPDLDCGYWIPDSKKSWIPFFFPVLMLFFALHFRVRILLYWKTLLEGITSLFSFSVYKIAGRNVLQFRKGLWYTEGDIGGPSTPQHRRKK